VAIAPSIAVGGPRVSVHPRLEQCGAVEPGQPPNGVVHPAGRRAALGVAEQVSCHEYQFCVGLHAAANGGPEPIHDQTRDARHGAALQTPLGLPIVEEEVA
jgi:hypothetical protein